MSGHVTAAAVLNFMLGGICILGGVIALIVMAVTGAFAAESSGEDGIGPMMAGFGLVAMFAGLAIAIPAILAGVGLMRRQMWGLVLAIVVAALASILLFPIGTLVGVYVIVVLVLPQTRALFGPGGQSQQQQVVIVRP